MRALFENKMLVLNAPTFDLKMQALCSLFFQGRNEDASKALNASSLNHKMPELWSLVFDESEDVGKALNASS